MMEMISMLPTMILYNPAKTDLLEPLKHQNNEYSTPRLLQKSKHTA